MGRCVIAATQSRYEADLDRLTSIKDLVMATGEDNGDAKTNKHEHSEREEAAHKLEAQEVSCDTFREVGCFDKAARHFSSILLSCWQVDNVEPADMFGPLLFLPEVCRRRASLDALEGPGTLSY